MTNTPNTITSSPQPSPATRLVVKAVNNGWTMDVDGLAYVYTNTANLVSDVVSFLRNGKPFDRPELEDERTPDDAFEQGKAAGRHEVFQESQAAYWNGRKDGLAHNEAKLKTLAGLRDEVVRLQHELVIAYAKGRHAGEVASFDRHACRQPWKEIAELREELLKSKREQSRCSILLEAAHRAPNPGLTTGR
jgi:hypothetical protein